MHSGKEQANAMFRGSRAHGTALPAGVAARAMHTARHVSVSAKHPNARPMLVPCAAEGEPEGHMFADAPHPAGAAPAKGFQRTVLREWNTLRANLPSSIWVRAYETRCAPMPQPLHSPCALR